MLTFLSAKKTINLVIDDYALRMVDHSGGDLTNIKHFKEKSIPNGLLEHGRILDEMEFYHFMKETVKEWGIKRRNVQFYAPDSLVIMRKVKFPAHLKDKEINGHFIMELGHTLYLPFDNPIFDVSPLPGKADTQEREGLLFAVPEDEMRKYTEILIDAGLKPVAADIRSIGVYRYFQYTYMTKNTDEAYLFLELNLNSIMISIFSENQPEFLRFQDLDIQMNDWTSYQYDDDLLTWTYHGDEAQFLGLIDDQIMELERIMNFYRYSIHKGQKAISKIMLLGDFPNLDLIRKKIEDQFQIPVTILDAYLSPEKIDKVPRHFIPALGLALKGGS
ncbi:hypothetical protein EW027_03470 [Aeribacillus pallidus]|uniref:type IV pilus biogenesis protein PilM n=1 Tax=Aeribacillus pallidus TaxID=33936 RepID=UPI001022C53A|nr:pilus assembly protein PilM [Aeribacillus pallidus]RZI52718.1 hypothetical protein EW027_03470 [Aeribacillus pallidus]